jgi:glucose/arabinose dehydrogenase
MNGALPNLGTRRLVLMQPHPTYANHHGGEVMIGRDNLLYIGFGDGGLDAGSAGGTISSIVKR